MTDNNIGFYPPVAFHFRVTVPGISGINEGDFQEVSGLKVAMKFEEVQEGGENRYTHRFPKPPAYQNLILKRGYLKGSPLIEWARKAFQQFEIKPKDVVIQLLDEDHNPLSSWNFVNAYPVAMTISDFKAQENSIVVETLELAFDYFDSI